MSTLNLKLKATPAGPIPAKRLVFVADAAAPAAVPTTHEIDPRNPTPSVVVPAEKSIHVWSCDVSAAGVVSDPSPKLVLATPTTVKPPTPAAFEFDSYTVSA